MTSRDIEMYELRKCQIRFTTPEGDYEGTVLTVCFVTKKVLVSKIAYLPKRILMGTLCFKFSEILSYTILSRPDATSLKKCESNRSTYSYAPPRAQDMCLLDDGSDYGDAEIEDFVRLEDLYEEEQFELKIPTQLVSRIPMDNVIFDRIDEAFHQAIRHILQQDCIGVSVDGPKIGRNGILSWFCVSTSSCTFLFDIETLGERAFQEGLKNILEDPNIEKVLHDCRQASDCLFHKFHTRLVNVFDTQVADLLVTMQRSKDDKFSKHISSLDSCLRTYLEVPEEYIHKPKVHHTYEDSVVFSRQRPLRSERRDLLLKGVMYLRSLKRELNFALLTPLHRGVEVYLQVLQSATDRELLLEAFVPEQLPQELIMEGIQVVRFKEFVKVPPVVSSGPPYRKLNNPVKDYANYCAKHGTGSQSSSLSSLNDSQFNDNVKVAVKPDPSGESRNQSVESTVLKVTATGKNTKSTIAEDMVQKNCLKLEENSNAPNTTTHSAEPKSLADIINFSRGRNKRKMQESVQPSKSMPETLILQKSQSQGFQDTSNNDSEPAQPRKTYPNALMELQEKQKLVLAKGKNSPQRCSNLSAQTPVQKNCFKVEGNSDSASITTDSDDSKGLAGAINYYRRRRIHQVQKSLQPSNLSPETLAPLKNQIQCFQDTSDSDSESRKYYPNVLTELQNPILSTRKNSVQSSSDSTESSDDGDPWAALRAAFTTCDYSAETVKRKIRFYPA